MNERAFSVAATGRCDPDSPGCICRWCWRWARPGRGARWTAVMTWGARGCWPLDVEPLRGAVANAFSVGPRAGAVGGAFVAVATRVLRVDAKRRAASCARFRGVHGRLDFCSAVRLWDAPRAALGVPLSGVPLSGVPLSGVPLSVFAPLFFRARHRRFGVAFSSASRTVFRAVSGCGAGVLIAWSEDRIGDWRPLPRAPEIVNGTTLGLGFVFVLWANFHGAFAIGLLLLAVTAVCDAVQDRFDRRAWSLLAAAALCLLATLCNPYGVELWRDVMRSIGSNTMARIQEWQSPLWDSRLWWHVAGEALLALGAMWAVVAQPAAALVAVGVGAGDERVVVAAAASFVAAGDSVFSGDGGQCEFV